MIYFLKTLNETGYKLKKEKNKVMVISGDFNYHLKYEIENKVSRFLNLMLGHNMSPCITEPTRIVVTAKPSLVDNIFINNICEPISDNILEKVSYDHLPNFILFESDKKPKKRRVHEN